MATLCWQPLDDLHAAAALRTRRFPGVVVIGGGCLGTVLFDHCCVDTMIYGRGLLWRLSREKLADMGKLCLAMTIGKEAVVPDASEAVGQHGSLSRQSQPESVGASWPCCQREPRGWRPVDLRKVASNGPNTPRCSRCRPKT